MLQKSYWLQTEKSISDLSEDYMLVVSIASRLQDLWYNSILPIKLNSRFRPSFFRRKYYYDCFENGYLKSFVSANRILHRIALFFEKKRSERLLTALYESFGKSESIICNTCDFRTKYVSMSANTRMSQKPKIRGLGLLFS